MWNSLSSIHLSVETESRRRLRPAASLTKSRSQSQKDWLNDIPEPDHSSQVVPDALNNCKKVDLALSLQVPALNTVTRASGADLGSVCLIGLRSVFWTEYQIWFFPHKLPSKSNSWTFFTSLSYCTAKANKYIFFIYYDILHLYIISVHITHFIWSNGNVF